MTKPDETKDNVCRHRRDCSEPKAESMKEEEEKEALSCSESRTDSC